MKSATITHAALALLTAGMALGGDSVENGRRVLTKGKGWSMDQAVVEDPTLPRVLLISDGAAFPHVVGRLRNRAYVDSWVSSYCQSERYNAVLAEVLLQGPYDVIHFNMGHHGFQKDNAGQPRIPPDQFEQLTKAFVEVMKSENPNARLIWSSATPVTLQANPAELDPENNPTIIEHNRMAAKVMAEMNVPANDLYGLMIDRLNMRVNALMYNQQGNSIIGKACADAVLEVLPPERQQTPPTPAKPTK